MGTYLDRILASHRAAAADDPRTLERLLDSARYSPIEVRRFRRTIQIRAASGQMVLIAEIKRRSPSKGDLAADLDPEKLAQAYAAGGAGCLSVLTDGEFFGGSADDLARARAATTLPVLRKDFTLRLEDVCDARIMGADAVLLIVAALSPSELREMLALAGDLDLDALVEVHDEAEVETAMRAGATMIGVNQRDLETFEVDTGRAARVRASLPAGVVAVAESGISGPDDVRRLREAGFHGILVGEALVRSADPAAAAAALRGA
ncbi:MAG: indole-3-glycerol phosphate synthase TrpC [Actinomycetota bacterium]|nr:indole-3-glycerol phosphate synthase TrpC [Actinomycetota bacterium]